MTETKRNVWKPILLVIVLLLVIAAGTLLVLRFGFGVDLFDRSGWSETADGGLCYLDKSGDPLTGWQTVEGATYYFDPDRGGAMATGWTWIGSDCYYFQDLGMPLIGWQDIDGERYCFDASGVMLTGWLEEAGNRYLLGEDGAMVTGWADGYYLQEDGAMLIGWLKAEDGTYYLGEDGSMHTGWLDYETGRYFFAKDGKMATGWLDLEDECYYFREDGTMAVGEVEVDGVSSFFTSTGTYIVLVNPWNEVPADFVLNLVEYDGHQIDADCLEPLKEMMAACEKAGYSCKINSAYRSFQTQQDLWDSFVASYIEQGYSEEEANRLTGQSVAVPGTSEHHLGYAVDLGCNWNGYLWLAEHCWEYGFILRYAENKTEQTGIIYEPWHFRYVGTDLSMEMKGTGLCLEEYMDMLTQYGQLELDTAA